MTSARPPHTTHFSASAKNRKGKNRSNRYKITPGGQRKWDRTFDTTNWIIHNVNSTPTSNLQNFLLPTALCIVDDKVCTPHRTCDVQLGRGGTCDHVRTERYADTTGYWDGPTAELGRCAAHLCRFGRRPFQRLPHQPIRVTIQLHNRKF